MRISSVRCFVEVFFRAAIRPIRTLKAVLFAYCDTGEAIGHADFRKSRAPLYTVRKKRKSLLGGASLKRPLKFVKMRGDVSRDG
jgi:hypothetical protein